MAWVILFFAGLMEICWAIGLKYTEGFSRLLPSVLTLAAMLLSIVLLSIALRTLPVGTAYAVWTGIGAVGAFVVGLLFFGDQASTIRIVSICLIAAGIVGMKLA